MVEWKKLGEVCSLKARIGWQGLTQKEHRTTGEYLLVTGTDFTSNYEVDFDHCVYVDKDRYTQDPNIQLKPNDVLITKDGTLGKMAVIENLPKPATLNGGLFVIRDLTGKLHHKYLLHYMLSSKFQNIIESNHTNGTIKHLTQALLTNFPIPIPTLIEQERIVDILDTFTSSIENLKQQIAQRRKQYEYYRDQLLDLEGKEGVEMKTLGEVLKSLKTGLNPRKNFVLNAPGSDCFYITVRELGVFDIITQDKTDRVTSEALKLINNRSNLEVGDILFSGTGTIGRTALIKEEPTNWNIKEGVYTLKPRQDIIIPSYLVQLLHANSTIIKISTLIVGDPIRSVPMKNLVTILIPIPSLSEQQRIVDILDKFEASIQNLEAQLSQREKQYEYYRNKLLTF